MKIKVGEKNFTGDERVKRVMHVICKCFPGCSGFWPFCHLHMDHINLKHVTMHVDIGLELS